MKNRYIIGLVFLITGLLTAAIAAVNAFYLYRKERSAVDESSDNK